MECVKKDTYVLVGLLFKLSLETFRAVSNIQSLNATLHVISFVLFQKNLILDN